MIDFLILIVGFVLLVVGADYLVKGASSAAKKLNVSDLIIGLTIVSIGTSAPELAVNVAATLEGSTGMAIGNVIGSNIFNIFVILGISALVKPMNIKSSLIRIEIPFAILAAIVLIVLAGDKFLDGTPGVLSRGDGVILFIFFAIFLYYILFQAKHGNNSNEEIGSTKIYSTWLIIVMIVGGLAALVFGGDLIVKSATTIARRWGVSDTIIGLTIVAAGTSLPELATSTVAAFRGNSDIAIGNIVGSNIFNTFAILGVSSTISPLPFANENLYDAIISGVAALLLLALANREKRKTINRIDGVILLACYAAYLIYLLSR